METMPLNLTEEKSGLLKHVDHTLLKADAVWEEIEKLCEEAVAYQMASVCVPPSYVGRIHEKYKDKLKICTVVGFPLGYSVTAAKLAETEEALKDGAQEIDMVINITDVKNGRYDRVEEEIRTLRQACGSHILKVIIEACYLTGKEKEELCRIVTRAGADYIKTSTGFGTGGASHSDVKLMKENIGSRVRIKAAGGIRSLEEIRRYLSEGCDRIGTSSAVELMKGELDNGGK